MQKVYVEKTASRGVAVAPIYMYLEPDLNPDVYFVAEDKIEEEQTQFDKAREAVIEELKALADGNDIFAAHLGIASDYTLKDRVDQKIAADKKNVQQALQETIEEIAAVFEMMDDDYMRERGADIKDIGKRMMAKLKGVKLPDLGDVEGAVVAARDLYPSDTVKIRPGKVLGIITEEGGVTSHVSIMAKSMNIPTLVGVKGILSKLKEGQLVCMDAEKGIIMIDPDEETLAEYRWKQTVGEQEHLRLQQLRNQPAITSDGKRIALCVNVGSIDGLREALAMNIDGVGLFRTEFLYMENTHFPTEEEQYAAYKEAAEICPKELTIRTLDIGGDKELPYFKFDKEENPFLGWRAIRISLDMKDMFKTQLRAILRASAFGHIRIMFPMIISPEEFIEAKAITAECMAELEAEGVAFDAQIALGMMMETPASVLLAEEFAKKADFFSIGTNDLTQYLLTVDRGNEKIADKYDYFHPAVLRAIAHIIKAGHQEGIKVGMCGEMAGDPRATARLLAMGLDEFSMSAGSIDYIREQILKY
jgi:phosphotransferase system enzyme I (PtsI)